MARKTTKGKGTKTVRRKKAATTKTAARKSPKKSGKATAKTSRAKASVLGVAPAGAMDVLRAWSSSRYSTR